MYKFYCLEDMTQEDLNNLALERNTLQQENNQLKEVIEEIRECFENNFLESTLEAFVCLRKEDYENLKDKLDKVKGN